MIKQLLIALIFLFVVVADRQNTVETATLTKTINLTPKATSFLQKYGYIEKSKEAGGIISPEKQAQAIIEYQNLLGLNETGVLDEETQKMMDLPRCGNPDKTGAISDTSSLIPRKRRHVADALGKWSRIQLTYKIWNHPKLYESRTKDVDEQIRLAMEAWSLVSPLDFSKTDGDADINIKFSVKSHGDGHDFDGPSGTLAHAFFPENGRLHFDDDEKWSIGVETGSVDLFSVTLHELGHSLGIRHKKDRKSIMFPVYGATSKLDTIDVETIQEMYGNRSRSRAPSKNPTPTSAPVPKRPDKMPDLCKDSSIDAMAMTAAGRVYIFKRKYCWLLNEDADGIESGWPRLISDEWPGLPESIDAAVTYTDRKIYFFKNSKFWRYTNQTLDKNYPRLISKGLPGIPEDIDAALSWSDGRFYFFKDDKYWRFDPDGNPKVDSKYPQSIAENWRGVPTDLDDALTWKNNQTFFFKGDGYYRYDYEADEVDTKADPSYPRSTAEWWFGCETSLSSTSNINSPVLPGLDSP